MESYNIDIQFKMQDLIKQSEEHLKRFEVLLPIIKITGNEELYNLSLEIQKQIKEDLILFHDVLNIENLVKEKLEKDLIPLLQKLRPLTHEIKKRNLLLKEKEQQVEKLLSMRKKAEKNEFYAS